MSFRKMCGVVVLLGLSGTLTIFRVSVKTQGSGSIADIVAGWTDLSNARRGLWRGGVAEISAHRVTRQT